MKFKSKPTLGGYGLSIVMDGGETEFLIIASSGQGGSTRYTFAAVGVDMTMNCVDGPHAQWFPMPVTGQCRTPQFVDIAAVWVAQRIGGADSKWFDSVVAAIDEWFNIH